MTKQALAAALIVGAVSSPAFAKNEGPVQYYFATADGAAYCGGLLLTQKGNFFNGYEDDPTGQCGPPRGDAAAGVGGYGYNLGNVGTCTVTPKSYIAVITTEDPEGGTNFEIVYTLDITDKCWAVYVVADGGTVINSGTLVIDKDSVIHNLLNRKPWNP